MFDAQVPSLHATFHVADVKVRDMPARTDVYGANSKYTRKLSYENLVRHREMPPS